MANKDISIKVTVKDNYGKLDKSMKAMLRNQVMVGVPAEKGAREKGDAANNATLAYIHDNGSPAQNIPARPFMGPGIDAVREKLEKRLAKIADIALRGDVSQVEKGLEGVGLIAVNSIRDVINKGDFAPLAPATIAARRARGRRSIKPLVDTSQLRNSITYVVRKVK